MGSLQIVGRNVEATPLWMVSLGKELKAVELFRKDTVVGEWLSGGGRPRTVALAAEAVRGAHDMLVSLAPPPGQNAAPESIVTRTLQMPEKVVGDWVLGTGFRVPHQSGSVWSRFEARMGGVPQRMSSFALNVRTGTKYGLSIREQEPEGVVQADGSTVNFDEKGTVEVHFLVVGSRGEVLLTLQLRGICQFCEPRSDERCACELAAFRFNEALGARCRTWTDLRSIMVETAAPPRRCALAFTAHLGSPSESKLLQTVNHVISQHTELADVHQLAINFCWWTGDEWMRADGVLFNDSGFCSITRKIGGDPPRCPAANTDAAGTTRQPAARQPRAVTKYLRQSQRRQISEVEWRGANDAEAEARAARVCPICDTYFSVPSNMRRHMRDKHEKVKGFTCEYCKRQFSQYRNLERHIAAIHQGETTENCNPIIVLESEPNSESNVQQKHSDSKSS